MKTKILTWLTALCSLTALCALTASCSPEVVESRPTLLVTHSELTFSYKATSFAVTLRSATPWTLTSDAAWLTTSAAAGEGNSELTVQASANDGEDRAGTITIRNAAHECTITVLQQQDRRNFLDITLEGVPESFERLQGAALVIPYRRGGSAVLESVSATVAGEARGSIAASRLTGVQLSEGAGEIRIPVSGRAGKPGTLLFNVAGLPPTVFGEAAQCMLAISEGAPIADLSLQEVQSLPSGEISSKSRSFATVSAVTPRGAFLQDDAAGIRLLCGTSLPLEEGDRCEVFLKSGAVGLEGGICTVTVSGSEDVAVLSKGNSVSPVSVGALDPATHGAMLCRVDACQPKESEILKPSIKGWTLMEMKGSEFKVKTDLDAPMKTGYGHVVGVLDADADSTPYLYLRSESDYAGLDAERVDVNATFALSTDRISGIPAKGDTLISFKLISSVSWSLSSSDGGWLTDWSATSGAASADSVTISVKVAPNKAGRRTATVTVKGEKVADITLKITQIEGKTILDQDFATVKESLKTSPKYYPNSSGTDISKTMASYGLDGWFATVAYPALTTDGAYGVLRIGKTSVKGYLETPYLTEIGASPTNIEVNLLGGKYKTATADWFAVEVVGPGKLKAGSDLLLLDEYRDKYKSSLIDNLPVYLLHDFTNSEMRRVRFTVEGATSATKIRFTATTAGSSDAAQCNLFMLGDIHITYAD